MQNKEKKDSINYKQKIEEIIIKNLKNAHIYKPEKLSKH